MAAVLDVTPSPPVASSDADASFEPYGRLLRMLMPSLRGVVVHNGLAQSVWASDEWDLSDDPEIIAQAIAHAHADAADFAGIVRMPDADRAVYCFAVRGAPTQLLGIVSLIVRLSSSQTEARPLQTVRQLVQPALECLTRELALRAQLGSREHDLGVRERDLEQLPPNPKPLSRRCHLALRIHRCS